jgi:hypothetical protein
MAAVPPLHEQGKLIDETIDVMPDPDSGVNGTLGTANGTITGRTDAESIESFPVDPEDTEATRAAYPVPEAADEPNNRYREFKGRHIQMMAIGTYLRFSHCSQL